MKKNKNAISLIIAIWLALIMSLLALYILEYMIPFWKNTKNIEQSVSAYYYANSAIEQTLYDINWTDLWTEINKSLPITSTWFSVNMTALWRVMPPIWQWNSEFDSNYNRIRIWEPIQIEVWWWIVTTSWPNNTTGDFTIHLQIPDLNKDDSYNEVLSWDSLKIINLQLSSDDDVLNASGSQITANDINDNSNDWREYIWYRDGRKLDDSPQKFRDFYYDNCSGTSSWCILKMSIINKLELTDWTSIPYIEWKFYNKDKDIPLRYTIIDTVWKSYGFQKWLRVKIPQKTLNEALDFTVFQ